jgi:hypothetical protein
LPVTGLDWTTTRLELAIKSSTAAAYVGVNLWGDGTQALEQPLTVAGTGSYETFTISLSDFAATQAGFGSAITQFMIGATWGDGVTVYLDEVKITTEVVPFCGDGICNGSESCASCATDCGPAAGEVCCDGTIFPGSCCTADDCGLSEVCMDHGCMTSSCADADGDGHADASCGGDDCDDAEPQDHPGASEVCDDGEDNDCNGLTDTDDDWCSPKQIDVEVTPQPWTCVTSGLPGGLGVALALVFGLGLRRRRRGSR